MNAGDETDFHELDGGVMAEPSVLGMATANQHSDGAVRSSGLLAMTKWKRECIFDGGWRPAADVLIVHEPATGRELARVGGANPEQVREVTAHAWKAHLPWRAMPVEARARILRTAAALLEEHTDELVEWIVRETGGLRAKATYEIVASANELYYSAAQILQPEGHVLTSPDPDRLS